MPIMADIVVKKADGTTNVTYVAKVASAGDKTQALWTQDAASTTRNQRPSFAISGVSNGPKTARRVSGVAHMPILRTIDGVVQVAHDIPMSFVITVPGAVTDAEADEAAAQFGNLLASTLIRSVVSTGYAPT